MFGKKGSTILKLPSVRNCFTLAMTNKFVVVINSLKVPKIKKILLYEIKFLVSNYSCLQNPWLGGYRPQIPVISFLNWICWTPPEQNSWVRHLLKWVLFQRARQVMDQQRRVKVVTNSENSFSVLVCFLHRDPLSQTSSYWTLAKVAFLVWWMWPFLDVDKKFGCQSPVNCDTDSISTIWKQYEIHSGVNLLHLIFLI